MERIFCKIKRVKRKLDGKRITAKVMSAVLIASSMLNAFAPVAAYAAEPELATVSLSETQHGKLSFDGTEDMTLAVEVGTDVTVNVTPDEGYFSDGITVFKGEEDGTAVDVKDGKATFTVEGDTIVTSTFYENGSTGSAAFKSVDVDEGKAVTSVEGYIRDHADAQYVGVGDELTRADVLTVTTTVIDGNALPEGTLDALWADDDGDGMSDHWEAMLSQAVSHAVLFEVDPKADYYVGWAGADISDAKLTEWLAAENNADANMRDGFIVDEATGLVYVPKSYTEKNDEGQPIIESSRIQLVYTTSDKAAEVSFDFNSSATDVRGDVAGKGKVSFPVSAASTKVTLATDVEALENLTGRTIDSVTVNGIEYTPDFDMWEYDAETGSLEFAMPPAGIHAMSVKMSDNFGKGVANFFRMPEPRMSMNNIGTIEFKSAPWVGQTFRTSGTNWYDNTEIGSYTKPAVEGNGGWESKTAQQAMGWQGVDVNNLFITGSSLMRSCDIPVQDTGTVKITNEMHLALLCAHAGVNPNFQNDPNYNNPNDTDGNGDEWSDHYGQHFRVFQVSGGEAIVGVTVPTSHSQSGAGFFKIGWRVSAGHINLHKTSANPEITDGNDCYSLEGAEFTVYNGVGSPVGTLVTNANGDTNTLELPEGTYTVRETKPPKGYLAAPDQQVTVSGGQTTTVQVQDKASYDPVPIALGKFDGEKQYNANNLPQGSASLEGAEFTIEYFDTMDYDSYDALKKAGVKPTRSWVVRTNQNGKAYLDEDSLVSGDDIYYYDGIPILPRGSVAVYESKAPTGYKLNKDVNFQKIQDNPLEDVTTFNLPEIPETVIRSDLEFTKKGDDGQDRLAGVAFKLTSKTTGESHVVVTDENGYFSSASSWNKHTHETNANDWALDAEGVIDSSKLDATAGVWFGDTTPDDSKGALPYDTYLIEELRCSANEGYQLIETSVIVSRDGKVYDFGTLTDVKASITTKAYDPMDGDSNIGMGNFLTIEDKVAYANLFPGRNYKLVAELHDAKTGDLLSGDVTEHTFTAQEPSGFEVVSINVPETYQHAGETITVYEKLYDEGGSLIAKHTDKDDVNQQVTVIVPEIGTTATDGADGDKLVSTDDAATVVDTVHYKNLIPGRRYALVGALLVKKTAEDGEITGEPLMVDGAPVVSYTTFTPEKAYGDADVTFTFDSLALKDGTKLVAAEVLFGIPLEPSELIEPDADTLLELMENAEDVSTFLAKHFDIEDLGQTVTIKNPKIATTALDGIDNDKNVVTDSETVIVDTVEYHNLVPGKEYTLKGSMQVKGEKDGKPVATPLEVDGEAVTAETTFTPEAAHGTVNVTFAFDSRDLEDGTQLVVFENLERNGNVLVAHEDIEDINQMVVVTVPGISTSARDGIDGDKDVVVDDKTTVIDTVEYKNLVPGKEYTLNGKLYSKSTGKPLMVGDKPVTGQTVFTPEKADGKVDVTFTFDSRDLEDKTDIVVFESLVRSGTELASHADIDDKNQTVTVTHSEIGTTAVDGADGDKNVITDDTTEVIDTVEYTGLIPGKEYTLKGTLHVKVADEEGNVTEKPLEVDGKPVTAETTFTPEKADGKVDVVFHFNSLTIPHDTEIVAFESLEKNGVEIAAHADIKDKAQTVTVKHPFITTSALDGIDGDKNIVTDDETVIVDTVKYSGLIPGKEYTLKGSMQVKKSDEDGNLTAEPLEVDGEPVTAETTFTPETASGEVEVTFTFDSRAIADKTDIVVFESLERTGVEIASHADIEDGKQTTTVTRPQIGTTALDGHDGDKNVVTDGKTTVIDTVEYKNVIPGKTYTLKGSLHVKVTDEEGNVTEKPLEVDGKPVTAETTFTPEKSDGKVEVTFTFDSTGIPQDTEMVAFESLEKNGVELVAHADIEDGKQTTTAHVTGISTTATDGLDGDKNVIADAETTITDEVAYENALTGIGYTMTGILMDSETGLPILTGDGSEKYTEADVAAFMQQLLDVLGLSAQDEDEGIADIVVSDEVSKDGSVKKSQTVRVHADGTFEVIDTTYETDEDGLTSATVDASGKVGYDALTDEQREAVSDVAVLKDSGIVLNYSATGELPVSIDMDALGKFIADNEDLISHLVYQTAEFTPEKYDGTVTMDFHFNANDVIDRLGGETKDIVVFEVMSKNAVADEEGSAPVIVASECDLDSEEQTVNLVPTVIGTTATDKSDGDHTLMAGKDAVITDRVTYEGLIPGKEYTLKATLMDKKTGEMLSINDQHVTAELKFTPNSQNGTIDIDLGKFDASSLDGHDLVVFEELYKQTEQGNEATEVLVAEHKDIDDEGQTVTVTTTPPGGFFGKTGGNDFFIVVSIAALAVLACGCAYYGIKNRRAAKAEDAAADEGDDTDNGDVSGDSEA